MFCSVFQRQVLPSPGGLHDGVPCDGFPVHLHPGGEPFEPAQRLIVQDQLFRAEYLVHSQQPACDVANTAGLPIADGGRYFLHRGLVARFSGIRQSTVSSEPGADFPGHCGTSHVEERLLRTTVLEASGLHVDDRQGIPQSQIPVSEEGASQEIQEEPFCGLQGQRPGWCDR